ncbi:MAG: DNA-binding protein [Planctomycetaceae bacterium]|nr:DNA-binding protein [Planctomycetaceae bacterium]
MARRSAPRFEPGQIVRHVRYGYRGVVVSRDPECLAEERWYQANATQPDRDQPWYHVLVDGARQVTYAAHTSLDVDDCLLPVKHPLIRLFFKGFNNGRHLRNDRPWPDE